MSLFTTGERKRVEQLAELTFTNPFRPERAALERALLGRAYDPSGGSAWHRHVEPTASTNLTGIRQLVTDLADTARDRMRAGQRGGDREYERYDDLVMHVLFFRADEHWRSHGNAPAAAPGAWEGFRRDFEDYFACADVGFPSRRDPAHVFAGLYQIHRAFHHIFQNIIGGSAATIHLRAAVWQSIFTHDMRRYRRSLYKQLARWPTLIVGSSGTGKELVATAIGRSQYLPFDSRSRQFADGGELFFPLHLAALPTNLVESELFGHAKGAFTGATRDRPGWLETAGAHGAVFLDEVGEIDLSVQVKLLRVIQTRTFSRVGEQRDRHFEGKWIAATNRDLNQEIERGAFRKDLYFRLCADVIRTPTLREQINGSPQELTESIRFVASQLAPDEIDSVTSDALSWLERHMPRDYEWPGNFRELEQCVRNIVVHNEYRFSQWQPVDQPGRLAGTETAMERLTLTAEQLVRRYCTYAYWKTGNYEQAAEHLQLDRRTVRAKIDEQLLDQWNIPS